MCVETPWSWLLLTTRFVESTRGIQRSPRAQKSRLYFFFFYIPHRKNAPHRGGKAQKAPGLMYEDGRNGSSYKIPYKFYTRLSIGVLCVQEMVREHTAAVGGHNPLKPRESCTGASKRSQSSPNAHISSRSFALLYCKMYSSTEHFIRKKKNAGSGWVSYWIMSAFRTIHTCTVTAPQFPISPCISQLAFFLSIPVLHSI